MSSRKDAARKDRRSDAPDEKGQHPHGCSSMNIAVVAKQFKGSKLSDDRNGIARVKQLLLHLRFLFLHYLGKVA